MLGEGGIVLIAATDAGAADVDLADGPFWDRLEVLVQEVEGVVGEGLADGQGLFLGAGDGVVGCHHAGFGGAVHVDDGGLWEGAFEAAGGLGMDDVAGGEEVAEFGIQWGVVQDVEDLTAEDGGGVKNVDGVADQVLHQTVHPLDGGDDVQGGTHHQGEENLAQ